MSNVRCFGCGFAAVRYIADFQIRSHPNSTAPPTWKSAMLVLCNSIGFTIAARDFLAKRGASDEHIRNGSGRSEQRSLDEKELPPGGLRRIWPVAALLVGYRPTEGYAPSSRLATGQIGRNDCRANAVTQH